MMKQPFDKTSASSDFGELSRDVETLRTPQLSDMLDECLTFLAGTSTGLPLRLRRAQSSRQPKRSVESDQATIEECLARYPQHAADLRPLLEVALEISRVPQPSSSPAAFAAGKRRMLEALAEKKSRQPFGLGLRAWVAALFGERRMAPARRRALTLRLTLANAAALVLLVGGLLLHSWLGTTVVQTATLEAMSGMVEFRPAGSETWLPASPAQQLEFGDRIRTGSLSAAVLTFFDGSKTAIEAETEIAIAKMRSRRDGTAKVIVLYQRQGQTYHRVQPLCSPASRFEVETPTTVTAVRGTEFAIAVEADGTTEVRVREGGVKVIARGKTVEVLAGHATSVEPDLPPAAPFMAPTPLLPLLMEASTPTITSELAETTATAEKPTPTRTPAPPTPTETPPPPPPEKPTPTEQPPTATPTPRSHPPPLPSPMPTPTEQPPTATPTPLPLPPTEVIPTEEPTATPTELPPTATPTELPPPPTLPPPEQSETPQSQGPSESPTATND